MIRNIRERGKEGNSRAVANERRAGGEAGDTKKRED
jgi:hypothetical protein